MLIFILLCTLKNETLRNWVKKKIESQRMCLIVSVKWGRHDSVLPRAVVELKLALVMDVLKCNAQRKVSEIGSYRVIG